PPSSKPSRQPRGFSTFTHSRQWQPFAARADGAKRGDMRTQIPEAEQLLAFYVEAGVDVALGEAPVDRFAERAPDAVETPAALAAAGRAMPDGEPRRPLPRLPLKTL